MRATRQLCEQQPARQGPSVRATWARQFGVVTHFLVSQPSLENWCRDTEAAGWVEVVSRHGLEKLVLRPSLGMVGGS